jgi:murein DD-endopeptidase MepM/ murein hydrolase activator NlpD
LRQDKSRVQQELRQVKVKQRATHNELVEAQQELENARARLRAARLQLRATRNHIACVQKDLVSTEARLKEHKQAFARRIRALYEASQPTMLAVLVGVTDYEDFTNRVRFARLVAEQDQNLLLRLVQFEAKLEDRKQQLEKLEAQQAAYHSQVQAETKKVADQEARTRQVLNSILHDRKRLEAQLAALEEESREIERMLARSQRAGGWARYSGTWSGSLLKPVPGHICSGFGMRMHPILGYVRMHTGVDISASYGTPIKAADKGLVVYAGWRGGYGKCVIIDHGSGIATLYAHMSSISVSSGEIVRRGEVVGAVGSTGLSTGPHLHFEVRRNGCPVDPLSY